MTETPSPNATLSVSLQQTGPIPLDAAFSVAPGESLALVGPSGSGKTTALRSIAGLYAPSGGRIVCNGAVWLDCAKRVNLPARARRVGMVFQSYALFPHLTAAENVAEALGDLPVEARRDQARSLLARWRGGLRCFCWTSRFPPWTGSPAGACAASLPGSGANCRCRRSW